MKCPMRDLEGSGALQNGLEDQRSDLVDPEQGLEVIGSNLKDLGMDMGLVNGLIKLSHLPMMLESLQNPLLLFVPRRKNPYLHTIVIKSLKVNKNCAR